MSNYSLNWNKERIQAVRRALSEWYESQRRPDSTLPLGDTDEVWAVLRDLDTLQTGITQDNTLHLKIRRWAEHELALLQGSGVRNYGQEQIVSAVLHRLGTGDWSTGEDNNDG